MSWYLIKGALESWRSSFQRPSIKILILLFFSAGNPEPGTLAGGGKPADAPFSTLDLAVGLDREVVATFPPFDSAQSYSAEAIIFSEIQNIKKYADTQVLNIGRKKRSSLFGSWLTGNRRRGRGRGKGKPRARAPRQRAPGPKAPRRPLQKRPRGPKRLQPRKRQPKQFPFHRQQQRFDKFLSITLYHLRKGIHLMMIYESIDSKTMPFFH